MTEEDLDRAISALISSDPTIAIGVAAAGDHPLLEGEAAAVEHAVAKRRHDFAAGRHAARRAMARLGQGAASIPCGPRRAPVWPRGLAGSISHAGGFAVAVVSTRPIAIGVDLELARPLSSDVEALVVRPTDRLHGLSSTLAFSAKESVYKALWPSTQWELEFADVSLEMFEEGVFTASAHDRTLRGRWCRVHDLFVTSIAE